MVRRLVKKILRFKGPSQNNDGYFENAAVGVREEHKKIIQAVRPYTMTSDLRIEALLKGVEYCIKKDIQGSFVECGVWRGGSVLAIIHQLQNMGIDNRDIYLYDTFEGMTEPSGYDVESLTGKAARTDWDAAKVQGERPWADEFGSHVFNEDFVRQILISTGYPENRIHLVKGPVEETIPSVIPSDIALLRLDTDWYASTLHELHNLYPLLSNGGVMIIDDYGHWEGCRKAVDEYFSAPDVTPVLLNRIDYTGRLAVKV